MPLQHLRLSKMGPLLLSLDEQELPLVVQRLVKTLLLNTHELILRLQVPEQLLM